MSHAGPGAPRTSWGRAAAVVLGVPLGLIGLTVALAVWAPTGAGSAADPVSPAAAISVDQPDASTPSTPSPASPSAMASTPTSSSTSSSDPEASAEPTPVSDTGNANTGQSGRSQANLANPGLEVVWRVETDDPVFFITVDDNLRDDAVAQAGLQVVRDNQIPITAFLTTNYVQSDTDYFAEVTAYGGSIQNHTVTHPFFSDPASDPYFEVCTAQDRLTAQFGSSPWMLRPPYGEPYFSGSSAAQLEAASSSCGVNRIVMWNAVVDNGVVSYNPGPTLRPGDIVLFHFWDPKFAEGLQMILDIGRANGLSPAPLEDYL